MKLRNLFVALLALPLFFVACEPENPVVDEVKDPTVSVTVGTATDSSVTFTLASTEAQKVAYLVIEGTETPTASEVLANGTEFEANTTVEITATELNADTAYTIVAAAQNSKAVVKDSKLTKTLATEGPQPGEPTLTLKSASEMTFGAEGGNGEIEYEIIDNRDGLEPNAVANVNWITDITFVTGMKISFTVAANDGAAREGKISVSYDKLSFDVTVKQAAKGETPTPGTWTPSYFWADFDDSEGINIYAIMFGDMEFGNNGWGVNGGTYYTFYIVSANKGNGKLPNGTYTLDSSYGANTIIVDYSYRHQMDNGQLKYGMEIFSDANIIISDGKIEVNAVIDRDGSVVNFTYNGDLSVDDGGNSSVGGDEEVLVADKWIWGGSSAYGNKYAVSGEGFSLDVHFQSDKATSTSIVAGEYIWTSTSWWGYNDFEDFTTRTFEVDGVSVAIDAGIAYVENNGDEYNITLLLEARNGIVYMIEYDGKIGNNNQQGDDNATTLNITTLSEGTYNSTYYFYTFKAAGDNFTFDLVVNDYQAKPTLINTGSYQCVSSVSMTGSNSLFYTNNFKYNGASYKPTTASTMTVTGDGTNVTITLDLTMQSGDKFIATYNGVIGGSSEGGSTELVKLATPTVTGMVSGNAATVSWNEIAGAKDYTVTLNGTDIQTVETAYIVYQNLDYSTTYSVSVVANPADTAVNTASDAGTATFTTEANPRGGNEGGEQGNSATLAFVKDLSGEYGAGYDMYCYYELTSGSDVIGFWLFNNKTDKSSLYDGTYTHVSSLNKLASSVSTTMMIEEVTIDGVNNGGPQESSTLVVSNNGGKVELSLDYNVIGEGVKNKKYVFEGTISK